MLIEQERKQEKKMMILNGEWRFASFAPGETKEINIETSGSKQEAEFSVSPKIKAWNS